MKFDKLIEYNMRNIFLGNYVKLRERHNIKHKEKVVKIDIRDVVMIKGEDKRGKWKIDIVKNRHEKRI